MILTFLSHQWTGFWRSKNKTGTIAAQLLMAFLGLYLIAVSIFIGNSIETLVDHFLPGKDVMLVFNGAILYYFVFDFFMRIQMQELPTLAIVPYLHLNIPKYKLVRFLNVRALFSIFNFIPLLLFSSFCVVHISENYGHLASIMYLLSIVSLTIFNNYTALYLKRAAAQNYRMIITGLVLIFVFGLLEYFKVFSISVVSNLIFSALIIHPVIGLVFILLAAGSYLVNGRFLKNNLYLEELKTGETKKSATDYPFLDRFGAAGTLVALEIKLILRNQRPRNTVAKGLLFLCYGFLMYKEKAINANSFGVMLIAGLLITGNMTIIYGQFMFGWQSAEFDGLLANKTDIKTFFKAKFLLLTIASTVLLIVVSLYGILSWKILLVQFAAYFYNIGVNTVIMLYVATRNNKYIDLSKGSNFNWQGANTSTMLLAAPVLLGPYLIYLPLSALFNPYWGLAGLTIAGLSGLFTRQYWLNKLVTVFNNKKYQIAAGFRERT